jgi:hypothetical protein
MLLFSFFVTPSIKRSRTSIGVKWKIRTNRNQTERGHPSPVGVRPRYRELRYFQWIWYPKGQSLQEILGISPRLGIVNQEHGRTFTERIRRRHIINGKLMIIRAPENCGRTIKRSTSHRTTRHLNRIRRLHPCCHTGSPLPFELGCNQIPSGAHPRNSTLLSLPTGLLGTSQVTVDTDAAPGPSPKSSARTRKLLLRVT